jgi:hypothetical protein
MPVKNESQVTYLDQAEIDSGDFGIMERIASGQWSISGGVVTAQGTADGTVAVSAGTARTAASNKTITAGNVSVLGGPGNPDGSTGTVSDSTLARFDLIVLNGSSQLGVIHGTLAGLSPNNDGSYLCEYPVTTNFVCAAIFIPPNATVVTSSMIQDKRIPGSVDAFHDQAHNVTGTNHSAGWGAKGSVLVGLTSGTGTALAVGSNEQVLTADSAQTAGVKWATRATTGAQTADVTTSESTTSTTYADLTTPGPSVTVTIGASGLAMVMVSATMSGSATGTTPIMSWRAGAGTPLDVDSAIQTGVIAEIARLSRTTLATGLTPGSVTFDAKYRVASGTGTFSNRRLIVIPL